MFPLFFLKKNVIIYMKQNTGNGRKIKVAIREYVTERLERRGDDGRQEGEEGK